MLENTEELLATFVNYKICKLKEIPLVFNSIYNGFTVFHNDRHFRIKELAEEFEEQFEYFSENTEKYITFSVPIKKELDSDKSITYKIKFIDSFRFMSRPLSNLVGNLSEGLHNGKCTDCNTCLDYISVKDDQLIFRCFE